MCIVARPVVHKDVEFMKHDGVNGEFGNTGLIVGVGSVESSFLIQWTKCLSDFDHPDFPSILVFIQYITQVEGPMWRELRGQGLSYNYGYIYYLSLLAVQHSRFSFKSSLACYYSLYCCLFMPRPHIVATDHRTKPVHIQQLNC